MSARPLFQIRSGDCGHGRIATNGTLGYDCALGDAVLLPGGPPEAGYLSAHAPSRVEIELLHPTRVTGFLNGTARWMPENPAVFLINENPVGMAWGPLEKSLPLPLAPGRHVLRTICTKADSRHTVWQFDPVEAVPKPRLALVTIGCYPAAESWKPLWHLCQSAVKQDRWLHVMGMGTAYENEFKAKVLRLGEFIRGLNSEYVLYTDGKDSFFLGGEEEILSEFARLGSDFVISMERGCWPVEAAEWRAGFPTGIDGRRFPNAGGWMGTKAGALRVLDRCAELQKQASSGKLHGRLARWQRFAGRFTWGDQGLLQLCYLEGSIKGDGECRIFTDVNMADRRLSGNEEFEFLDGRVRMRMTGAMPQVVHFPGNASGACRDQWAAMLGPRTVPSASCDEARQEKRPGRVAVPVEARPELGGNGERPDPYPIWVYWEGPMPDYIAECLDLMRLWHPGQVRLVTRETFDEELWTRDRDVAISRLHVVARCDWIRLYLLRWYGGMYADLDCIPLRDWTPWIREARENLGGFCGFGSTKDHVATSLMASRAGGLIVTVAYEAATSTVRQNRNPAWNDLASHVMTPAVRGRESLCRIFPIGEVQAIGWWEQACYFDEGEEFPLPEDGWCLMLSNQQLGDRGRRITREELRTGKTRLACYLRESRRLAGTAVPCRRPMHSSATGISDVPPATIKPRPQLTTGGFAA